ncbi:unnamed protein product [Ranitomeya imitator]|uniref:Uncharacterized protein n=1 Tax=Ranitomeya imitator TaxID=111125 RepID=A0ABN9L9G8_9NEOB|nr:unnamed protein product [Ranitomeya imitator]
MTQPAGRSASPREEGELEDGEISDDSVRPDSPKPVRHRPSNRGVPHQYRARPSSRPLLPTPHVYRPKEQYRLPPRLPQPSSMGDICPRPSFWERSHDTLGRIRSRGRGGRFWEREWMDRVKGRSPPRKSHAEDESFEELLLKYKQIKLELESINKNEKLVLKEEPAKEVSVVQSSAEPPAPEEQSVVEDVAPVIDEKPPVKAFQAFELKPLRQKLKPITEIKKQIILEESKPSESAHEEKEVQSTVCEEEPDETEQTVPSEIDTTDVVANPDVEEEQLSELHLRLLALQSASKKWHQKEQLVLKESKEKLSKGKMEPPKEGVKPEPQKEKSNTISVLTRKAYSTTNAGKPTT